MIRFCGGETAAVEKKEPFEDASKKILLIVRKTESVHDLLKRWYLAKESEKARRSSNGPSSEIGMKLQTDYLLTLLTRLHSNNLQSSEQNASIQFPHAATLMNVTISCKSTA